MPKIKLIWTENLRVDGWDLRQIIRCIDPNEFEEVTDIELQQVRTHLHRLPRPSYGFEPTLLVMDETSLTDLLGGVKKLVEKEMARQKVEAARRIEATKKRKATALERKRARLEQLKKELGEG